MPRTLPDRTERNESEKERQCSVSVSFDVAGGSALSYKINCSIEFWNIYVESSRVGDMKTLDLKHIHQVNIQ